MYDSNSKGISYTAGFFMLIAFAIAGVIFAALIYAPVWTALTGKDVRALSDGIIGPGDTNGVRAVQAIYGIIGFFLPALFAAALLHRYPLHLLGFTGKVKMSHIGIVILLMMLAVFASAFFSFLNHQIPIPDNWRLFFEKLEADYMARVEAIVRLNNAGDFIIGLVVMALLPAICEETLFRGGLQNFLTRSTKNPWVAIIIVSLIFSVFHLSFYGFLSRFFPGSRAGIDVSLLWQALVMYPCAFFQ